MGPLYPSLGHLQLGTPEPTQPFFTGSLGSLPTIAKERSSDSHARAGIRSLAGRSLTVSLGSDGPSRVLHRTKYLWPILQREQLRDPTLWLELI